MKIAICGYGRHGKDTFGKLLSEASGLRFVQSTSQYIASKIFLMRINLGLPNYRTVKECFDNRSNHRDIWATFIWSYNYNNFHPDFPGVRGVCMYAEMLEDNDLLVGIRREEELKACRDNGIIDLAVWVDAGERLPIEPKSSCRITADDCELFVDNNINDERCEHLKSKAEKLAALISHNSLFGN